MADSARNGNHDLVLNVNKDASKTCEGSDTCAFVPFLQKLVAEMVGTYFLIFAGCAAVVVNKSYDNVVTLPGIAIVWGLVVMVMIYSVGHISGAHFNPAVTIAFATNRRFPLLQVFPRLLWKLRNRGSMSVGKDTSRALAIAAN